MSAIFAGMDLGGANIHDAPATPEALMVDGIKQPTRRLEGAEAVVARMTEMTRRFVQRAGITPAAVGVSSARKSLIGPVLAEGLGAGIPLTDEDRHPRSTVLRQRIIAVRAEGKKLANASLDITPDHRRALNGREPNAVKQTIISLIS